MAEEVKKDSCCACSGGKTIGKFLVGAVVTIAGFYLCWSWRVSLVMLIKGCLGPLLVLIGLVIVAIAKD